MIYTDFSYPPGNHKWIIGSSYSRSGFLHRYCPCGFQLSWSPIDSKAEVASWLWKWKFDSFGKYNHYKQKEMPPDILSKECLAHVMNKALE